MREIDIWKGEPQQRELLWNLLHKFFYEMTNYYDDELDALGNYPSPKKFWTEKSHKALAKFWERATM
jgi:hypothetical protein